MVAVELYDNERIKRECCCGRGRAGAFCKIDIRIIIPLYHIDPGLHAQGTERQLAIPDVLIPTETAPFTTSRIDYRTTRLIFLNMAPGNSDIFILTTHHNEGDTQVCRDWRSHSSIRPVVSGINKISSMHTNHSR